MTEGSKANTGRPMDDGGMADVCRSAREGVWCVDSKKSMNDLVGCEQK